MFFFEVSRSTADTQEEKQHVCWRGLGFLSRKKYVRQVMKGKPKIITNTALLTPRASPPPGLLSTLSWEREWESGSSSKCSEQICVLLL